MRVALALLIPLALAFPASASHCLTWTTTTAGANGTPIVEADGKYVFIAHNFCDPQCDYGLWVYEETNGIAGLQRGDEIEDDTCHGMIAADTLVY